MTISPSKPIIARSDIEFAYADSSEPDAIGVEASLGLEVLFSVYFEEEGRRSIEFGKIAGLEFDPSELSEILGKIVVELSDWEAKLRQPGGAWSKEVMGKST